jgi:hypothetical protein
MNLTKVSIAALVLSVTAFPVNAGGSHEKTYGHKHGHVGPAGPTGPQGARGEAGESIVGPAGKAGNDSDADSFHANLGAQVRWYDWEHVALHSGYRYDTIHGGHTVDMAVVQFKVGTSHEERRIKALESKIEALLGVAAVANTIPPREMTIRGR